MNSKHLLLFLTGYVLLFFLFFQGYRYIIDPDATGYLSVAEQLARGNIYDSINGIWSPLNSWFLAPFIHFGFDGILTQKYLNGIYGLLCLTAYFYLIKKLHINYLIEIALMLSASLLILYFSFGRLFGDLLQVLFLLLYLNIVLSKNFSKNYKKIILAALIGGVGFYAKAYTLYFAIVHLPLIIYLSEKSSSVKINSLQTVKKIAVAVFVLLLTVSFWMITLKTKYKDYIPAQKQITGTLSQQYNQPRVLFYAPPYKDGYSIIDDISYFQQETITPFTNSRLFVYQLKLVRANFLQLLNSLNEFSFMLIMIILIAFFVLNKFDQFARTRIVLLLSFIITWCCGFLFFHVENRFLWIVPLSVLALAGIMLTEFLNSNYFKRQYFILLTFLTAASFSLYPVIEMKLNYGGGKNLFEIADAFKKNGIKGNILMANQSNDDFSMSIIINYLSKCRHYGPFVRDYSTEEIMKGINAYDINYFILYYSTHFQKELLLTGDLALHAANIYKDIYPGVIVLSFTK
ncbi:MAG TPA: hypothetical protein VMY77_00135 [Chitinophagaceae bacterium]|nr:hypothetical protein [Chitinophagaceae bacterium]